MNKLRHTATLSSRTPLVGVIMGSQSDWDTMKEAAEMLETLGVSFETRVVSAHRTPDLLFAYSAEAAARGLKVIIAGAGGAAHLPGMCASKTSLPVLGVPIESRMLKGIDSLLSIVQMPAGVPVGTFAIGKAGAANAALFAAAILSSQFPHIAEALKDFRFEQTARIGAIGDPRHSSRKEKHDVVRRSPRGRFGSKRATKVSSCSRGKRS